MSKVGILGIIALFGSMVLFTFELIGKTMNHSDSQAVSLLDIIGKDKGEWIAGVNFELGRSLLDFIFNNPLYMPLLALGIIMLVISGFVKK